MYRVDNSNIEVLDLIKCKKTISASFFLPEHNEKETLEAVNQDKVTFQIDLNRRYINLNHFTNQQRKDGHYQLLRLDISSKPHANPPDNEGNIKKISGSHIHIYTKEHGARFAYDLNCEDDRNILASIFGINCDEFCGIDTFQKGFELFKKISNLDCPYINERLF